MGSKNCFVVLEPISQAVRRQTQETTIASKDRPRPRIHLVNVYAQEPTQSPDDVG
jgi:hypothetical protein